MARPAKPVKRQQNLTVKFTRAEIKFLDKLAGQHGMRRAHYVREMALGKDVKARLSSEEIIHYRNLTGMANNLNQLAHAANSRQILTKQILEALEAINLVVDKLR